ncbi:MAG: DUF4396 domain-containing protein [Alphaproteobacteria bacterium]|nr:DUF4396 domain-containing protein [Alphaproteobacteria bacterium]
MVPHWLHWLALASLGLGLVCLLIVAVDVARHPQRMWIMSVVWPVVASFGTVLAVLAYFRWGRRTAADAPDDAPSTPFSVKVGTGTTHCGAGCTLGDICAEWLIFAVPGVLALAGWPGFFSERIFAVWVVAYVFAFAFGVAFQYFTIKPMRDLSPGRGLLEAVKADAASLTAWQFGMYGFMAIAHFWIFGTLIGTPLEVTMPEFWFMMQIAMIAGFLTSYPVNGWLIRTGIKEAM